MMDSIKQALHMGNKKEKTTTDAAPLATGAQRLEADQPTGLRADANTSNAVRSTAATAPASADATAAESGHRSVGTAIKEAFQGAPWDEHHEGTMEALTHAKQAHIKAVQAQQELQAATKAKQDAELAERRRLELERETELHRHGNNDLDSRAAEYENAKSALATHKKNVDHHSRLAQEAEAAAVAKEEEARRLAPLHEQHQRGLAPLQDKHTAAQRALAEAEEKRAALVRELEALDANMGGLRSRHQEAAGKLEEHNRLGGDHKTAALAAAEEARLLRAKANEAKAALEPHNAKHKDAHGLLATREAAYNKARQASEAGRDRLPQLQKQAEEAARKAKMSALAAQQHAGAFEKLKQEAEAEDAKKAKLWAQVQQKGHFTDDNASKTDLRNLADRFHTVLKNPIDTGTLANPGVTTEIRQSAARIASEGPAGGKGAGLGSAAGERDLAGAAAPTTPERVATKGDAATGASMPARDEPGMIRKSTTVTTPAHAAGTPVHEE